MLNNTNAVVILWTGNDLPDYLAKKLAEVLIINGITIPEMMKIVYKDQDELSQCLIRDANGVSTIKVDIADNNLEEALKKAVIYIGKRFEGSLMNTKNLIPFALEFQTALSKARNNLGFNNLNVSEDDLALINAAKLISTTPAIIPGALAKQYRINKCVCELIKQIYNQFT